MSGTLKMPDIQERIWKIHYLLHRNFSTIHFIIIKKRDRYKD